jgi:hypothetical protein
VVKQQPEAKCLGLLSFSIDHLNYPATCRIDQNDIVAGINIAIAVERVCAGFGWAYTVVRAPGTVHEDERQKSVVSRRFEGFIDTVDNVTTGMHVHKGEPLMRIYGPNLSSAAAEYLSALNARPPRASLKRRRSGSR